MLQDNLREIEGNTAPPVSARNNDIDLGALSRGNKNKSDFLSIMEAGSVTAADLKFIDFTIFRTSEFDRPYG